MKTIPPTSRHVNPFSFSSKKKGKINNSWKFKKKYGKGRVFVCVSNSKSSLKEYPNWKTTSSATTKPPRKYDSQHWLGDYLGKVNWTTLPEAAADCGCGQICRRYFRTAIGCAWSTFSPDVPEECSISGGPMTVARAWADILLRSDADTTSERWSRRNTRVAWKSINWGFSGYFTKN